MIPGDIEDGRRGANAEDRLEALEICVVPGRLIVDVSRGSKKERFTISEVMFRSPINLRGEFCLRDKEQQEKKGWRRRV